MRTSWSDSVANSASENAAASGSSGPRPTRATYIPPHLRNQPPSSDSLAPPPAAPSLGNDRVGYSGPVGGSRWGGGGGSRPDHGRSGYGSGGRGGGGWNNRSGGRDRGREREVNPFGDDGDVEPAFGEQENTGINFDAYEDIPVETSGHNVPPPVNTFADIDLGEAVNQNIRRCKYVKPTPVQRNAIPILLAGRDLMACAQTGSGKTAAFCFPIIAGIMREQYVQRPHGGRTMYPLALILSPTRELSSQVLFCFRLVMCILEHAMCLYDLFFLLSFCLQYDCRYMMKPKSFPIKLVSRWWLFMEAHQSTNRFKSCGIHFFYHYRISFVWFSSSCIH